MKKILTLSALALMALTANAKDYTDQLSVSLAGNPLGTQESTISVDEQGDGKYTLSLNNFQLAGLGGVGNIRLENVDATSYGETIHLSTSQTIVITEGDDENVGSWLGPMLGDVPVSLNANINGDDLYAVIKINGFGGVDVVFGDGGFQIKNSGFEEFHTATYVYQDTPYSSDEPNAWHSFNSGIATGDMAILTETALLVGSTSISEDVRPGSTGTKSVLLQSGMVLGFQPANGTMTTGQMQAGSIVATDPANCAFLDFENEALDGNGDPFYTVLNGTPDSLAVWVKFKQGVLSEDNADYKYATVSAVLTDGTRYQDPEVDTLTYNNVVAKAQNAQIESNNSTWQRLSIPFDYDTYAANGADAKALLVTISTNAQPGVGSSDAANPDQLYVDDIELIYNNSLKSLNIKGTEIALTDGTYSYTLNGMSGELTLDDITAVADGQGAYVNISCEQGEFTLMSSDNTMSGTMVVITVTSNDLLNTKTYTVFVEGVTTGIEKVETTTPNGIKAIYTIDGRRVNSMDAKGIYVVRKTDGTTVKIIKK